MDFFKKNGKFIELGGFGLAFICLFLPFLRANVLGFTASVNMLQDPTTALGILSLLLILVGLAITGAVAFKQDLLAKLGNVQGPAVNYGPLGVAGLTLLFVFIAGISNLETYVHLSIGFYLLVLSLGAVIASAVIRRFVLKDMYMANGVVAPQPTQPVMNQGPIQPVGTPQPAVAPVPQQPAPQQPVAPAQPPVNPNQNQQ